MRSGLLLAALSAITYAMQNVAVRAASPGVDPFVTCLVVGLPTVGVAAVSTLGSRRRRGQVASLWNDRPGGGRRLLLALAGAGILMYAVGNPLFYRALNLGGVVVAIPAGNTVVVWSGLLAAVLLRERLSRLGAAGIGLFLAGVALVSWGQGMGTPVGPGWFWAVPLAAIAGLCWSSGGLGTRYALGRGLDPFTVLTAYGVGLVAVAATATLSGHLAAYLGFAFSGPEGLRSLGLLLLGGILNLAAQISLTLALRTEAVARATVVNSSSVAIAALMGRFWLGEELNSIMGLGVLATFTGAALVQGGHSAESTKRQEESPHR